MYQQHVSGICQTLAPYAADWKEIATGLGFKPYEIKNIAASPMDLIGAPKSYLLAVIGRWSQWAPSDARGSKSYATLENLRAAVNSADLGIAAENLVLN